MDKHLLAQWAKNLLNDDFFKEVIDNLKKEQISVIINTSAEECDKREDAYRHIKTIEEAFPSGHSILFNETFEFEQAFLKKEFNVVKREVSLLILWLSPFGSTFCCCCFGGCSNKE